MGIIYCITNIINDKKYIGQTTQSLEKRWKEHIKDSKRFKHHFYNAICKYGTECWELEILEEIDDIDLINEAEMNWIEYYDSMRNGYNSTSGGKNNFKRDEISKEKMKIAKLGKIPWNKGIPQLEEQKINHSKIMKEKYNNGYEPWNKGKTKIYSEETRQKMSDAKKGVEPWNKGRHYTEETKEKMRLSKIKKEVETSLV